ncbi:WXG100 family type VII secretion target [Streptomyces sp. NPDC102405]|uniref:WXG100 family type VII secretion target n=1 Tax=Streptomyces sp. NPDC102405 TaxID=3366170 RepID=UPI0037F76B62
MGDKDIDDFEYVETNQCISAKHSTPFGLNYDMDQMKDMVRDADPGTVTRVATAWEALSKDLVGPGGIKEALDAAVEHVLAHWEGQSADLFRERAQVISKKITDSSTYASHTSVSLKGAAATLSQIKPEVLAMEKPGKVSSALDYIGNMGDRDDSGANNALKGGAGSQEALDGNAGSLSEGREAQLRMAVKMEALGAAYNSRAAEMGSWKRGSVNDSEDYPGDPGGVAPAPVVVPTETATRSPQRVTTGTARSGQTSTIGSSKAVTPPSGITGGAHKPTVSEPQVGTAIDGISGGRTGGPTVGAGGGTVSGGSAGGGAVGGGGFIGGAAGATAGGVGAARGGTIGRAGAAGGVAGRAGGAGGAAGRAGAGGVAGAGAAKGAAGRVGGTARGGVVGGTPKSGAGAGAGRGTAGGSGLHSSRGAAGKGASAVRKGGIAGAPGSRTGRRKEDEQREGERPDYLVEDEETWTPQTDVAPRVIE